MTRVKLRLIAKIFPMLSPRLIATEPIRADSTETEERGYTCWR